MVLAVIICQCRNYGRQCLDFLPMQVGDLSKKKEVNRSLPGSYTNQVVGVRDMGAAGIIMLHKMVWKEAGMRIDLKSPPAGRESMGCTEAENQGKNVVKVVQRQRKAVLDIFLKNGIYRAAEGGSER
jgi:phosphoribosylformylglycinamidine (FGAM) synthase-like enzyme